MTGTAKSGFWFLAVGGAAALTHLVVFSVTQQRLWPELANASGFLVAFFVSFSGHRLLSFRDAGTTVGRSFQRFGVTALAGFVTNEALFVLLLRVAHWYAFWALLAALLLAAVQTFLLSRFWAFRR
ncbi:MAG: GtrA family protein [Polaromonas sp.]